MRANMSSERFLITCGLFVASQLLYLPNLAAQGPQPPGQQQQQQQQPGTPAKSNQVNPNGKSTDLPDPTLDPTKDPMKDPANDITLDPTRNPDLDSVDTPVGANIKSLGGDAGDIASEAPDYTGPAILSRGFALTRPAVPVNERFRLYAGISAIYDSGLTGAYVQGGIVPTASSAGADFNWGLSGKRYRRKDIFDLNYSGHYYEYYSASKYSGQDQSFAAGYSHEVSQHLSFGFRETAGLYSNTYSVLNSTAIYDTSLASSTIVVAPNTEAFDDRTYFSTTTGSVTYQKTARLSFSAGAAYFLVQRDSAYLANTNGYQITGDISYRITKKQTIGIYYAHSAYTYQKIFGNAASDSIGANYAISLSRNMDLSFRAGETRYDSQTLETVVPNPLVQQVLGIQSGIEKYYFVAYSPDLSVTLNRTLRHSNIGASFIQAITPGNGLILTSRRQSESVYWSLPAFHKYMTQLVGGHDTLNDSVTGPGSYSSYYARLSLSRPVTRVITSNLSFDYRQLGFAATSFHQTEYRISLGFRFTPAEGSVKFW
jgi:hypothetical protein